MALKMVIRSRGQGGLGTKSSCIFGPDGGTIGRGSDCTWVLADPRNEISSLHATVVYEGGQFCLTDESTNGVFINGTARPVGRGIKVALRQGDVLRLGQYEIGVIIGSGADDAVAADLSVADGYGLADLVTGQHGDDDSEDGDDDDMGGARAAYETFSDPAEGAGPQPRGKQRTARLDPLAAFNQDRAERGDANAAPSGSRGLDTDLRARPALHQTASEEDAARGIAGSFQPQSITEGPLGGTEFDRYLDGLDGLTQSARPLAAPASRATAPDVRTHASAGIKSIDSAMTTLSPQNHNLWPLLEGLGLTDTPIPDEHIPGLLRDIGATLRHAIGGLHDAYDCHEGSGDRTFRIAAAQLQPLEDNPIKFAADARESIALLFGHRRAVHLGPQEAVRECLDGLRIHRAAVAAGTAAGLQAVIASFAPEALASRFAKYGPNPGAGANGSWLWDMFAQYFDEARRNQSHGLRRLFDEVFAQSYDQCVRSSLNDIDNADMQPAAPPPPPSARRAWPS